MRKQKSGCTHQGFTLIELLVVVAIIALLISIAMPSLKAARRSARRTVCLTNLKQIGTALQTYLPGNRERFPVMGAYWSREAEKADADPAYKPLPCLPRVLAKELGAGGTPGDEKGVKTEALLCPADVNNDQPDLGGSRYFDTEYTSYEWEPLVNGNRVERGNVTLGDASSMYSVVMRAEVVPIVSDFEEWHATNADRGGKNRLYADLHVEPFK